MMLGWRWRVGRRGRVGVGWGAGGGGHGRADPAGHQEGGGEGLQSIGGHDVVIKLSRQTFVVLRRIKFIKECVCCCTFAVAMMVLVFVGALFELEAGDRLDLIGASGTAFIPATLLSPFPLLSFLLRRGSKSGLFSRCGVAGALFSFRDQALSPSRARASKPGGLPEHTYCVR